MTPLAVQARLSACPHPLLFIPVSGAHLYGFESANSDWDLRGCHVAPKDDVLALSPGPETIKLVLREQVAFGEDPA